MIFVFEFYFVSFWFLYDFGMVGFLSCFKILFLVLVLDIIWIIFLVKVKEIWEMFEGIERYYLKKRFKEFILNVFR